MDQRRSPARSGASWRGGEPRAEQISPCMKRRREQTCSSTRPLPLATFFALSSAPNIEYEGGSSATRATIPREAMGMGDPHLLGMIGAFLGGPAVLFSVCASAFYALGAALLGRVGFGKPLPFGPFLALAALTWLFGGWRVWDLYSQWALGY